MFTQKMKRKKKKKKKIYSKIKEPIVITDKEIENPMQMVSNIINVDNIWSQFIDKAMIQNQPISVPYEHDLRVILKCVTDPGGRKKILKDLMKVKDYDPFKDPIPTRKMSSNYGKCVERIQRKLLKRKRFATYIYMKKRYVVDYHGKEVICVFVKKQKESINKELFHLGVDVVFVWDEEKGDFIISSNPERKLRLDFTPFFQVLDKIEPNTWHIYKNRGVVMTLKDKSSSLSIMKVLHAFTYKSKNKKG